MTTISYARAEKMAALLTEAGAEWVGAALTMPEVRDAHVHDVRVRDHVELVSRIVWPGWPEESAYVGYIYRRDGETEWKVTGWSDASRGLIYQPALWSQRDDEIGDEA